MLDRGGRVALGVDAELVEALLDEAPAVGLVVDRVLARVAEARRLGTQDPCARAVERHHPHRARRMPEQQLDALAHLLRGLVREGDREDLARPDAAGLDQPGEPVGQHARLARAGPGEHEQRAGLVCHGLALGLVEAREQVLEALVGGGVGHEPSRVGRRAAAGDTLAAMAISLPDEVRATCALIAESARSVTIDHDALAALDPGPAPAPDAERHLLDGPPPRRRGLLPHARHDQLRLGLVPDAAQARRSRGPPRLRLLHDRLVARRPLPRRRPVDERRAALDAHRGARRHPRSGPRPRADGALRAGAARPRAVPRRAPRARPRRGVGQVSRGDGAHARGRHGAVRRPRVLEARADRRRRTSRSPASRSSTTSTA